MKIYFANPPFNISWRPKDSVIDESEWPFGVPPPGNGNMAWVTRMIQGMGPDGRAVIIMPSGETTAQSGGVGKIRKRIFEEAKVVEAIVKLPGGLFANTGVCVDIWVLNARKCDPDRTLFVNASDLGEKVNRRQVTLTGEDVAKIKSVISRFRRGEDVTEPGFAGVADFSKTTAESGNYSVGAFVPVKKVDEKPMPSVAELQAEIFECAIESIRSTFEIVMTIGNLREANHE